MTDGGVVWYAAGGGIMRRGPFRSQVDAWRSMVLAEDQQIKQQSVHPSDTRVWPEEISHEQRARTRTACKPAY